MKKKIYAELAYVLGLVILAFGTALMERADFGMSMVVAPAYILHLKLRDVLPFFSFGMAEYCLQAVLIVVLCLVLRRFRLGYRSDFRLDGSQPGNRRSSPPAALFHIIKNAADSVESAAVFM